MRDKRLIGTVGILHRDQASRRRSIVRFPALCPAQHEVRSKNRRAGALSLNVAAHAAIPQTRRG